MTRDVLGHVWIIVIGHLSIIASATSNVSCASYPSICDTVYNFSQRVARVPIIYSNGTTPSCNLTCSVEQCCESSLRVHQTCESFDANTCISELGPSYCKYADDEFRICTDDDSGTCTASECCFDCVTRTSEFSFKTGETAVPSYRSKRCAFVSASLGQFSNADMCAKAAIERTECDGIFEYSSNRSEYGCQCCVVSGNLTADIVDDAYDENVWGSTNWDVYVFEQTKFCETPSAPQNGLAGSCTSRLASNSSCVPACDSTFRLSRETRCISTGIRPRLVEGSCFRDFDESANATNACRDLSNSTFQAYDLSFRDFTGCSDDTNASIATCGELFELAELTLRVAEGQPTVPYNAIVSAVSSSPYDTNCSNISSASSFSTSLSSSVVVGANESTIKFDITLLLREAFGLFSESGAIRFLVSHDASNRVLFDENAEIGIVIEKDALDLVECAQGWANAAMTHSDMKDYGDILEACRRILDCEQNGCAALDIASLDLTAIPPGAFASLPNVISLDLSDNRVAYLDAAAFSGASNVRDLVMDDSSLAELGSSQFAYLTSLEQLSIRNADGLLLHNSDTFGAIASSTIPVRVLDFHGGGIVSLSPGIFEPINETLVYAQLASNNLSTWIAMSVGGGLARLEELDMSNNALTELSGSMFEGMRSLRTLILTGNAIANVDVDTFRSCGDSLIQLWIDNNRIDAIPANLFTELSRLSDLSLHSNAIATLQTGLFAIPSLASLNLQNNGIRNVQPGAFSGVKLSMLDLSGQALTTISDGAFRNTSLQRLKLTRNDIRFMSAAAFRSSDEEDSDERETFSGTVCANYADWSVSISDAVEFTCDEISSLTSHVQGMYLGTPGTSERSAAEACCTFSSGGWRRGLSLQMDGHSTITCFSDGAIGNASTGVACACGDDARRFDVDAYTCVQRCQSGERWVPADVDEIAFVGFENASQVGRCVPCDSGQVGVATSAKWPRMCDACEPGKFSDYDGATECRSCPINTFAPEGATSCEKCTSGRSSPVGGATCEACSWAYAGSEHCEFMMTGISVILGAIFIILGLVAVAVLRCRKERVEMSEYRSRYDSATRLLKTAHDNLELMSSAWRFEWSEIKLEKKLAAGGAGQVWSGRLRNKWPVAIKTIFFSEEISLTDDAEIKFLQRCRHKRLVLFLGCGRCDDGNVFTVIELMNGGSFDSILWKQPVNSVPWSTRLQILVDSAEGLVFLHLTCGVIHRDLKTPNILLQSEDGAPPRAKIADFGLARFVNAETRAMAARQARKKAQYVHERSDERKSFATSHYRSLQDMQNDDEKSVEEKESLQEREETGDGELRHFSSTMTGGQGTIPWQAPEIFSECLEAKEYSQAVDTYAFGVIMWETLSFASPWSGATCSEDISKQVVMGKRPEIDSKLRKSAPKGYVELLEDCWAQNAKTRPLFNTILRKLQDMIILEISSEAELLTIAEVKEASRLEAIKVVGNSELEGATKMDVIREGKSTTTKASII